MAPLARLLGWRRCRQAGGVVSIGGSGRQGECCRLIDERSFVAQLTTRRVWNEDILATCMPSLYGLAPSMAKQREPVAPNWFISRVRGLFER